MTADIEKIRDFFQNDRYAMHTGIEIKKVSGTMSECAFDIGEYHLNAGNVVQGGAIFTLADFAFAVAANQDSISEKGEANTVSIASSISFIRPPDGKRLIAKATCISEGKRTVVYQVTVKDDVGTVVAEMLINGYKKKQVYHDAQRR